MKKKFFGIMIVAIITIIAGWNISRSINNSSLTDLALNNIEALADLEDTTSCTLWGCISDYWYDCHVYVYGNYVRTCEHFRG
jgi:hypothetical protein